MKIRLLILAVVALGLALCVSACAVKDATDQGDGDPVVGSVNGAPLYRSEYESLLGYYFTNDLYYYSAYLSQGVDMLDEASSTQLLASYEESAWREMVYTELLFQLAEEDYGITFAGSHLEGLLSADDYRYVAAQFVYSQLYTQVQEELAETKTIGDDEARAAYEADPAAWNSRLTSHILIACDVNDAGALAEAKTAAEEIISQLDAGADFAALAEEYSDDSSAANGGRIDSYINAAGEDVETGGSFYAEYVTAAYQLAEVGDYSQEPVLSSAGYHIIKLDAVVSGYEAAHDMVAEKLQEVTDDEIRAAIEEKISAREEAAALVCNVAFKYYQPEATDTAGGGAAAGADQGTGSGAGARSGS